MHKVLITVLCLLLMLPLAAQSDEAGYALIDSVLLSDLEEAPIVFTPESIGETDWPNADQESLSFSLDTFALAPDGSQIAAVTGINLSVETDAGRGRFSDTFMCLYRFDDAQWTCQLMPRTGDEPGFIRSVALYWSPDSRYVAATEDFYTRLIEPDIWLYEVETGAILNRTDDGVIGDLFDVMPDTPVDILPTWNPANNDLFFFRYTGLGQESDEPIRLTLQRIPGGGGAGIMGMGSTDEGAILADTPPELVADLTGRLTNEDDPLTVFEFSREHTLQGRAAISPDGTQMAVVVVPRTDVAESALFGVWTIDLQTGEAARVLGFDDLFTGLPSWAEFPPEFITGVGWSADSTGLVVTALSGVRDDAYGEQAYYVDLASGAITAQTDYTGYADEASLLRASFEPSFNAIAPAQEAVIDSEMLLYIHFIRREELIELWTIPADFSTAPQFIGSAPGIFDFIANRAYIGSDGETLRLLIGGAVITLEREN